MTEADASSSANQLVHVVDDDPGLRDSLRELLDARGLAHELYESGDEFLANMPDELRGCVLLDYHMEGQNGIEVLDTLRQNGVETPVIMITAHGDVELAVKAMQLGAFDFIEKPWKTQSLFDALDQALTQEKNVHDQLDKQRRAKEIVASFTPREKDVFDQLIEGASNKLVARALDLSPRTVEFYRANVLEKAGAQSIAELVRLAFRAKELEG